jgi:hypothetical protein
MNGQRAADELAAIDKPRGDFYIAATALQKFLAD